MKILEKKERRLGEKLFLKGERCMGPKCAMVRRAYAPGVHGSRKGRGRGRTSSEYGEQMREKQKLRFFYGLGDRQVKRYVTSASRAGGIFGANLTRMIERRLDVAIRRLGFVASMMAARQAITHGRITVNGRAVSSPSYGLKKGDVIGLSARAAAGSGDEARFANRPRVAPPPWLSLNPEARTGMLIAEPEETQGAMFDIVKIKEFYRV